MPHALFVRRRAALGTLAVASGLALAACGHPVAPTAAGAGPIADPHSRAQPTRTAVTHLGLDLRVDFATKVLTGTAELTVARKVAGAELILDTDGLAIGQATVCGTDRKLTATLGAKHPVLGAPLTIALPADVTCVAIQYTTSPDAKALLWVEPAGTAGGAKPMVFTQSEATLGRSWVPLQDSPGVRFTYDATVHVDPSLLAVMSSADNPRARATDGVYHFHQPHPIPSYLMALAVGDLAFRPIGERTGVYSEPSVVDAAAHEFVEVDAMMATAEKLYGPYRWGRYDMLVLPPSFPFGGMENPMLTFLTPTLITGDRALVSVIAHELAHSWAGNLVTNATWNDVWLNEGITTYVERRIMEALRGGDYADMLWHLGRQDLDETLAQAKPDAPSTRLSLTLNADDDADNSTAAIAYEKGSLFMRTLEHRIGRDKFDRFLKDRFDRFAFQSIGSQTFVDDTVAHLAGDGADRAALRTMIEAWVFQPGLPADATPDTSAIATRVAAASRAFAEGGAAFDASGWKTLEWVAFVRSLPPTVSLERLKALDAQHHLTDTHNDEIAMYWLAVAAAHDDRDAVPAIDRYLLRVGRLRMVREVYAALAKQGGFWLDHGREVFQRAAPHYHPITRAAIGGLLAGKARHGG
jgi:leukotriene-A4 hydrolase